MRKKHYIDNEDLQREACISQQNGAPTERFCSLCILLAKRMLLSSKFYGYPRGMKADMVSESLLKCIKALRTFKPSRGKAFSYFTAAVYSAIVTCINKFYKEKELRRSIADGAVPVQSEKMKAFIRIQHERLWWNNGVMNKRSKECPGEGWTLGMKRRK